MEPYQTKIRTITHVEEKGDYQITHAIMEDGTEASGWGEWHTEEPCEVFFHQRYNSIKFRPVKTIKPERPTTREGTDI